MKNLVAALSATLFATTAVAQAPAPPKADAKETNTAEPKGDGDVAKTCTEKNTPKHKPVRSKIKPPAENGTPPPPVATPAPTK